MKIEKLPANFDIDQLVLNCKDCMRVHKDFWKDKSLSDQIAICKNECLHPERPTFKQKLVEIKQKMKGGEVSE